MHDHHLLIFNKSFVFVVFNKSHVFIVLNKYQILLEVRKHLKFMTKLIGAFIIHVF